MEENTTQVVLDVEQQPVSFLTGAIDLGRLLRDLKRQQAPAVQALVKLLDSKDEKIRLTAAKALLELSVQVAKEINSDALNRMIAEVKLTGRSSKRLVEVEDDSKPLVDFTQIREVG